MCQDACETLAGRGIAGVILPLLPVGATGRFFNEVPGGLCVRPQTLTAILVDVCRDLRRLGILRAAVVNNNYSPEHMSAIYAAVAEARQRYGVNLHYMDITHPHEVRRKELPETYVPNDFHAGRYETSLMMASHRPLVDDVRRTDLPAVEVDLVREIGKGRSTAELSLEKAYIGFPAAASAEEGREAYKKLCAMLVREIELMLAGEEPRGPGWYARIAEPDEDKPQISDEP
jgi:creatinine amidohydrolase